MDNLYGDVTILKSAWDGLSIGIHTAVNALGNILKTALVLCEVLSSL